MKSLQVHRVNFFEPEPQAIRCLSYDSSTSSLAVSRADSSIEIWDVKGNPFMERVIPGSADASVESLAWCKGRLFSAGLHGYVTEYDLATLSPKYQLIVTSGCPVWCIAFNKQLSCLAIGNEDGHVVLHDMSPEGLDFNKKFDRQEGSILCLDWHKNGKLIVTGSIDAIRVWSVETGHVTNRIILSRSTKNTPTIVWCISILSDMTIVSGDSSGKTSFWDGNTGTFLSNSGVHKEDILALTVSEEEDVIYTTGVEPTITMYMKSPNGIWMKSVQIVAHSHDVRALTQVGQFLVSGGDDCNLVFSKYPPKTTVKFFPFCQKPYAVATSDPSCILFRYPKCIEVWSIGKLASGNDNKPTNLLRIKLKDKEQTICSSISPDGKWLAYSSQHQVRLFNININKETVTPPLIYKVTLPDDVPSLANHLLFTPDSTKLLLCAENKIFIIKCDVMQSTIVSTIERDSDSTDEISLIEISLDNKYVAFGCYNGSVIVYCLETLKIHCRLPQYNCQPTVIKFDPSSENLIAVYTDRRVIEYSLKKLAYTPWCKQQMLFTFQSASYHPVTSVCFCSDKVYLHDENALYIFDRETQGRPNKKKSKLSENSTLTSNESTYQTITKYEHISSIHSLMDDLVVVQIASSRILDCLPPPVWKKKYGT